MGGFALRADGRFKGRALDGKRTVLAAIRGIFTLRPEMRAQGENSGLGLEFSGE